MWKSWSVDVCGCGCEGLKTIVMVRMWKPG